MSVNQSTSASLWAIPGRSVTVALLSLSVFAAGCDDRATRYAPPKSDEIPPPAEGEGEGEAPEPLEDACECEPGEVYRKHNCVPTLDLGCGPGCVNDSDCAEGLSCLSCGGSADCASKDCRPACGVADGPHALVPNPLRIDPTSGSAGEDAETTIRGTSFFIGALGHRVVVDNEDAQTLDWDECALTIRIPSRGPGENVAIWVSQYSGGEPFALAGFYTFEGGVEVGCQQPGFACNEGHPCCETAEVPMLCESGICHQE